LFSMDREGKPDGGFVECRGAHVRVSCQPPARGI